MNDHVEVVSEAAGKLKAASDLLFGIIDMECDDVSVTVMARARKLARKSVADLDAILLEKLCLTMIGVGDRRLPRGHDGQHAL